MLPGLASVAGVAAGRFEARRPGAFLAGVLGFVGVLCAAVMCFAATPQPHSRTIKLHVVGALAGQLGLGDCREPAPPQHDLARLAQLSRAPADATVLFGGMLGHGVDGRYVAQRSPHALAQLLSTLNPTVAGLAAGELAQRPTSLLRWAQAMEAHGIAVVASNLTCRHQRAGLCATVARQHMGPAEVGGGRVGVISLVTDDLAVHVEPAFLVGTGMAPAVQVARQQARKLRNSGVAVVVAMVHQGRRRHSERKLMKLAEGLRGDVHVILTDGLGAARDSDRVIRVGHGSTAVHIVAIAPGALNEVALRVRGQAGGRARVVASVRGRLPTASTPRDPVTAAAMARLRETYCRDWGTPLIANQDGTALTRAALIHLALGVMRRDAAADVAMLHAGALSRAGPWPRGVSRADLGAVFATPHRVVVATLTGQQLATLFDHGQTDKSQFHFLGMRSRHGSLTVREWLIDGRQRYRVAMPEYVALGAGGAVPEPDDYVVIGADGRHTIRDLLVDYLKQPMKLSGALANKLPRDLQQRATWRLYAEADISAAGTHSSDNTQLRDPRLNNLRAQFLGVRLDSGAWLNNRVHSWRSRLVINYGSTTSPATATHAATSLVSSDDVRLESAWGLRWLRHKLNAHPAFPIPLIFARARSEIDVPAQWSGRLVDVDTAIGLTSQPTPRVEMRLGGGWRWTGTGDVKGSAPLVALSALARRITVVDNLLATAEVDARYLPWRDRMELWGRGSLRWRTPLSLFTSAEWLHIRDGSGVAWQVDWRFGVSWAWISTVRRGSAQ